ncbi:MAG: hypothetical protein P8M22_05095 [Phycisphaerales bacterium]|nr:hypothetical protein [Phycisphaerales bacterium]
MIWVGLSACTDRSRAVNAGLRERIHDLEEENRSRDLKIKELEIQLESAHGEQIESAISGHPAIPVVTNIQIDATSGRRQQPDESGNRPLEIHVKAVDGHNRPIQLAGSMRVQVTLITQGQPPRELYSGELTPQEVREAWRGGVFGGPTWMINVPVKDEDLPDGTRALDVDIFYDDLRTGQQLVCGDKVDIR